MMIKEFSNILIKMIQNRMINKALIKMDTI